MTTGLRTDAPARAPPIQTQRARERREGEFFFGLASLYGEKSAKHAKKKDPIKLGGPTGVGGGASVMALLPYDCTREFFEAHPLVHIFRATPSNVHNCVTLMLEAWNKETDADARPVDARSIGAKQAANAPTRPARTSECPCATPGARFRVDPARGDMICSACGVTERYVVPDNCTNYSEPQMSIQTKAPPGVADWAWASSRADEKERQRSEVMSCMAKLNQYRPGGTFHPVDELKFLHRMAMVPERASSTERAIAALLFPDVREAFDLRAVETAVRSGASVPKMPVKTTSPWGELRCKRCDALVTTPYEQKRHPCRWGQKKRRRVSE